MRKAVKWDEKATFFRGIITYLRPALKPCSDGLLRPASSRRGLGPFMGLWNTNSNVSQGFFTGHRITFEGAQGRILLWSSKRKCMWASMHFPCCLHTTWNYDGQGQGGLGSIFPTFFLTFEKFKYLPLPYCFVDFWCLTPESVIVPTSFGAVPFDRWPWHFVLSVERFGLPILEVYWLPNPWCAPLWLPRLLRQQDVRLSKSWGKKRNY